MLNLDERAFTYVHKEGDCWVYQHESCDFVGLFHQHHPLVNFANCKDLSSLKRQYLKLIGHEYSVGKVQGILGQLGFGGLRDYLLELDVVEIDGHRFIQSIQRIPQPVGGFTFIGHLILPLQTENYQIKCVVDEKEPFGSRENLLALKGCSRDEFYDAEHDESFSDHALSRCRRILSSLKEKAFFEIEPSKHELIVLPGN